MVISMKEVKEYISLKKEDQIKLKQSYAKALQDTEFSDFIKKFKVKEKLGVKYTSSLQDSCKECNNCKKCKSLLTCKNNIPGFCYTPFVEENIINFSYVSCKYKNKEIEDQDYLKYVYLFDIPKDIQYASLKDVYKDDKQRIPIIQFFKEFLKDYGKTDQKGLYLSGSFGSGKSYLIAALFNECAKKKIDSAIVYFPEFLRKLKSSFQSDLYEERFEYIKKVPLLLIDDIGAENLSAWGRDEILGPILQYRMDEHLPTFFTSNLTLTELEDHLSVASGKTDKVKARRIVERIKQLTVPLELIGKNRRD